MQQAPVVFPGLHVKSLALPHAWVQQASIDPRLSREQGSPFATQVAVAVGVAVWVLVAVAVFVAVAVAVAVMVGVGGMKIGPVLT